MVGSVASSSARSSNGVDRFYNPPAVRRQRQLQQQQRQQQQQQEQLQKPAKPKLRSPPPAVEVRESGSRVDSDDSLSKPSVSSSPSPPPVSPPLSGNLDRFLEHTTPVIHARYFSKTGVRGRRNYDASDLYFSLEDLWESFREWSAYGAGVPLVLNGSESVIQYYVPYLSGMQLYLNSSKPCLRSRRLGEDSDGELYRDTSSDGSSECGAERRSEPLHEGVGSRYITERINRVSLGDKHRTGHEGSSSEDGEVRNPPGLPVFEYLERDPPHGREPLVDKISVLACQCPELKTYKSCDLSPSSWMSVAWYPIYRIPTGPTLRDLDACFLTFHSLATPLKETTNGHWDPSSSSIRKVHGAGDLSVRLPLPIFGLASYKFKGSIWTPNGLDEREQVNSLLQAADSWLRLLQVDHPDFSFFVSHSNTYWR